MIKNANLPAMPVHEIISACSIDGNSGPYDFSVVHNGLTKLELFCLHHGVPETGDPDLDSIIRKGNHQKAAMMAMQGLLAKDNDRQAHNVALQAVQNADALLAEWEK